MNLILQNDISYKKFPNGIGEIDNRVGAHECC